MVQNEGSRHYLYFSNFLWYFPLYFFSLQFSDGQCTMKNRILHHLWLLLASLEVSSHSRNLTIRNNFQVRPCSLSSVVQIWTHQRCMSRKDLITDQDYQDLPFKWQSIDIPEQNSAVAKIIIFECIDVRRSKAEDQK